MITFFSTLGDQFFLNMQRRGNRLGTFGHHRRPSRRIGKRREASVNSWELSGTVETFILTDFLHVFVTKSVKFGRTEVSIVPRGAKFQDLSLGKGPGPWICEKKV